jgi:hypothetical protein
MGYNKGRYYFYYGCACYLLYKYKLLVMAKILNVLFFLLLSLAVMMMITGLFGACNPAKKAEKEITKAKQIFNGNLSEAAKFCAEKFPDKTEYIKGDSIVILDTLYVGDVVFDTLHTKDTVYIVKNFPGKVITKTIKVTDTFKIENKAAIIAANVRLNEQIGENAKLIGQNDELRKNLSEWKAKAKKRWNLWFVVIGLVAWNLRKNILRLIKI